ncbi:hypothetical protein D3C86_1088040 [compost metagenome]
MRSVKTNGHGGIGQKALEPAFLQGTECQPPEIRKLQVVDGAALAQFGQGPEDACRAPMPQRVRVRRGGWMMARIGEAALGRSCVDLDQLHVRERGLERRGIDGGIDHHQGRALAVCFVERTQHVAHHPAAGPGRVRSQLRGNEHETAHSASLKAPATPECDSGVPPAIPWPTRTPPGDPGLAHTVAPADNIESDTASPPSRFGIFFIVLHRLIRPQAIACSLQPQFAACHRHASRHISSTSRLATQPSSSRARLTSAKLMPMSASRRGTIS